MKHVTIVSKPAKAEQTTWVDLKNVFGFDLGFVVCRACRGPGSLDPERGQQRSDEVSTRA